MPGSPTRPQYAWAKLAKAVIGTDNVDAQLGDGLPAELVLGLPGATIDEVCAPGGTVLWLGPDPKEELPVLYLRLRHAVERDGVQIVELGPARTGLVAHRRPRCTSAPARSAAPVDALLSGDVPDGGVAASTQRRDAALPRARRR